MRSGILRSTAVALLMAGLCACQTAPETSTDSTGVTYTKTIHDLHVWNDPGFTLASFKGKTLAIPQVRSEVEEQKKPEEAEQFARLQRMLRDELAFALERKQIFQKVLTGNETSAGDYLLDLAIVEYYPGNAALRFTVGFGAGYPSTTVRGLFKETASGRAVQQFRTQREFEARPFEYTDSQILENNIKDLAADFADYLERAANGRALKD